MEMTDLKELLNEMSLEEKVGQMTQLTAAAFAEEALVTGPTGKIEMVNDSLCLVGSILGKTGAEDLKQIQEEFIKKHPHHIPMLFMFDVINGMETIFPIPLAQGCTFSPEMVEEAARVSATEATAKGLHVTFSPMLDLVRDARWGRVMESTGEDTWLNSEMGKAMVRGYQGSSKTAGEELELHKPGNIAGCIKHFAGYGAPEGGREYDNVELSERTLREYYLPAYRAAAEEGCVMVMSSFNTLNLIPSTANQWLMRKVLREEMGFDGVVIADWNAIGELIKHGIAEDSREAAKLAILAGIDIDMASNAYMNHLPELVRSGEVEERLVDEAVWRILKLKNDLGLFENPLKDGSVEREKKLVLCEEHRNLARKIAAASFVLLKNEEALPLDKKSDEKIAFIGPYADNVEMFGSWSFPQMPKETVTIKNGIKQKKEGVLYAKGTAVYGEAHFDNLSKLEHYTTEQLEQMMQEAMNVATASEKVILCIGEHRGQSGEAGSRANIQIPENQLELLRKVHEVNPNIVSVVFSGRPLDLKEVVEFSKAVLMVWMPGTEGGNAIADILFGDIAPEGRLSMSIPVSVGQVPIYYNRYMTGRPNLSGRIGRVNNSYLDETINPLYPFGYGLSYTEFSYGEIILDKDVMRKNDILTAKVTVQNSGTRKAVETVQLYLRDVNASVVRPRKMLKGIQKIALEPGESKEISFEINEEMLKFYDINMEFVSEPGVFQMFIGHDSDTQNMTEFKLI